MPPKKAIRLLGIAWIWLVASVDIWCCQWLTVDTELNPLARQFIIYFGLWGFAGWKVFGTFLVTECLRHLRLYFTIVIALVQLGTVLFLGFAG